MTNYSGSKCPSCENTNFEMVEDAPFNSKFKFMYVRCMECKTVITMLPFYNVNVQLDNIGKALKIDVNK